MTGRMSLIQPLRIADARANVRHVFIRDLVLPCLIGVHSHERKAPQSICINLDLAVREGDGELGDTLSNVVCYEEISNSVRDIVSQGHVNLVETLAETIAAMCLKDQRVRSARVRIEKLDVFKDAASAGVEIERFNTKG